MTNAYRHPLSLSTDSTVHTEPDLMQDQSPDVSISTRNCFFLNPTSNTHFLQIIFNIVQPPLFGFLTGLVPSGIFLNI